MSVAIPSILRLPRASAIETSLPAWVVFVFVASVFSKEVGHATIAGIDYDLIGYNFCVIYLLIMFKDFYFNRSMLFYFGFLLIAGIISKLYLNYLFAPFWKQYIPLVVIYSVTYDVFKRCNYRDLFEIYFQFAFYSAIFGYIQLFVKVATGIQLLTKYSGWFIDSVAYEPSHYAVLMMPAAVYAMMYFKRHVTKSIVVIGAVILTFSSTAIMAMLISVALLYQGFFYFLLILPLLYFVFTTFLVQVESLRSRLEGFTDYFEYGTFNKVKSATSISFLSNTEVAIQSLKENPLLGSGLGGHEEMYKDYYANSYFRFHYLYGINANSGHNLLIRIVSETGLLGAFLYIRAIFVGLIFNPSVPHRIISIACFSHFFCRAMKLGGYFDYGTPFFAMMMIFNYYDYKYNYKNK